LRIISQLDRAAMSAYFQAYGRWGEAERAMKTTPLLIKLPSGYIQPSPWLGIANKQLELMHKYLSDLGLSPVSRARVAKLPSIGPKPWETSRACDKYLRPQWGSEPELVDEFFGD
jgi:P27 family predicted phage terminase small subunit